MDFFSNLFSSSDMLNEQIAHRIMDATPEDAMAVAIADLSGNMWTNQSNDFIDWQEHEDAIALILERLADGQEIVLANCGDYCFVACDIEIESFSKGYAIIALDSQFLADIETKYPLVEFSLKQISVLASAIQANNSVIHDSLKKANATIGS